MWRCCACATDYWPHGNPTTGRCNRILSGRPFSLEYCDLDLARRNKGSAAIIGG